MTSSGGRFDIRDRGSWRAARSEAARPEVAFEIEAVEAPEDAEDTTSRPAPAGPFHHRRVADLRRWLFGPYAGIRIGLVAITLLALAAGALAGPSVQAYYLYDGSVDEIPVEAWAQGGDHTFTLTLVHRPGPPSVRAVDGDLVEVAVDPSDMRAPVVSIQNAGVFEGSMSWVAPQGEREKIWRNGKDLTPSNGLPYVGYVLQGTGVYRFVYDGDHPAQELHMRLRMSMYEVRIEEDEFSRLQTQAGFVGAGLGGLGVIAVELRTRRS